MRIMKLSEHQINILNYTLILIVIQDKSYFNEFFVYYKLQLLATVISAHGEDIETQCSQAISQFPRIRVKNMMCACYSCALRGCFPIWTRPYTAKKSKAVTRDVPIYRYRHRLISVIFSHIGIGLMKIELI